MVNANSLYVLKASFRGCPISDRKEFPTSSVIMPISIGQKIFEGEKFMAMMNIVNRSFKQCTILVDDTVQRHTWKIEFSEASDQELYQKTYEEGNAWLERNKKAYQKLTIPYQIMRWNDWFTLSSFKDSYAHVNELYCTDEEYRNAINANVVDFLSRYFRRISDEIGTHVYERAFSLCVDYLKEECAVMCLWTQGGYEFELYPNDRNKAMSATYRRIIKPQHANLLRPVALRFKKYPLSSEQQKAMQGKLSDFHHLETIE